MADAMIPWLMCFGPMKYAQADNGGEFKGALLILLRRHGIGIINGNPRHPQSQGLVEQGNGTVKARIHAWMKDNKTDRWSSGLLEVCLSFYFINAVL